jgi:molybdopterin/thiamine biosynthesis adenylyltransferase
MLLVISEAAQQYLLTLASDFTSGDQTPVGLTAQLHADEGLVRIWLDDDPIFQGGGQSQDITVVVNGRSSEGETPSPKIAVSSSSDGEITARFTPESDENSVECEIEVVRLDTDVFNRLQGIFDTELLRPKTVAVIGLGSGGSLVALELAKSGVGNFILVDFDRLHAHNISRHVCGLSDVGRFKTRAVRDKILQHNPLAQVICHEVDVNEANDLLHQVVVDSDLVVAATDNEVSRYMTNEACLEAETPAVYGGAYERAFAGEVVRVVPGEGGCYACVRQGMADVLRPLSADRVFDYTEDTEDADDFQAEPGLGLDVGFIAMIQAKVALMTLLRGENSHVGDIDAQMVVWTNTPRPEDGKLFSEPMARYFVSVSKSPGCPACGYLAES